MAHDVFISHHTKSSLKIAQAICDHLESISINCWIAPRDTQQNYARAIVSAIKGCKVFIIILNNESSTSEDVLDEINQAVKRIRNKEVIYIVPFHISDEEISDDASYYLDRLHWIEAVPPPPVEERVTDLVAHIQKLLNEPPENFCHHSSYLLHNIEKLHSTPELPGSENFYGRASELRKITNSLKTNRIVCIHGVGGSGKTALAKEYIRRHKKEYDTIIFARFESSLQDLIISDQYFRIDNVRRRIHGKSENDAEYAEKKIRAIQKYTENHSTLIVLDNFDVSHDPLLYKLSSGSHKMIITTRTDPDTFASGWPRIYIDALEKADQMKLFRRFYERPLSDSDAGTVYDIINWVGGHTLTIELIAKLMNRRGLKPQKMYEKLVETGISSSLTGSVQHGGAKPPATVYSHVKELFHLEILTDEERSILMNLSLLPVGGVKTDDFVGWCDLEDWTLINNLADRSWIHRETDKESISLHPVIADIVREECHVSFETCKTMVDNLAKKFHGSWNMSRQEKTEYGALARSLYLKNPDVTVTHFDIYHSILKVFRALEYNDLFDRLANSVKGVLGDEPSVELGWYYYQISDLGIAKMAYDEAIHYLKKSIGIFELLRPDSYELAYVIKHLSHTYHRIYENKDSSEKWLDKARECLERSGRIFEKCVDRCSSQMGSQLYAVGLNCYHRGQYEEALKYEQESYDIFMKLNGEINSDTNAPMRTLAKIYSKLGRFDDAIDMQNRVIAARRELWGSNQGNYFRQFETLADIYYENHMYEKAVRELERVIELIGPETAQYQLYWDRIIEKIDRYSQKIV